MISEGEVSIQKNQGNFRVGVYQISRLNPQILGLISGATEFLVEMSLGRSIPRPIAKPVVAGHTRNDILATRAVVGDKSRLHVRREKALGFSGCNSRPGTGSLHPVATETTAEVTKRSELSV